MLKSLGLLVWGRRKTVEGLVPEIAVPLKCSGKLHVIKDGEYLLKLKYEPPGALSTEVRCLGDIRRSDFQNALPFLDIFPMSIQTKMGDLVVSGRNETLRIRRWLKDTKES